MQSYNVVELPIDINMIKCETCCEIPIKAGDVELGEGDRQSSFDVDVGNGLDLKCQEHSSCCNSNEAINNCIRSFIDFRRLGGFEHV